MSNIQDQLDDIINDYLRHLEGDAPAPDLSGLPGDLRDEARIRIALLDAMWGSQLEPAEDDPVARRFGLDRPDQRIAIDGRRVASLRRAAGIDLKELLRLVTTAGGTISGGDLLRLEQNQSTELPQPTATALVAALGTSLHELEAAEQLDLDAVRSFLDSPDFDDRVASWAADHEREVADVRPIVVQRVLALQYRATDVTHDQLVAIVEAIFDSLKP